MSGQSLWIKGADCNLNVRAFFLSTPAKYMGKTEPGHLHDALYPFSLGSICNMSSKTGCRCDKQWLWQDMITWTKFKVNHTMTRRNFYVIHRLVTHNCTKTRSKPLPSFTDRGPQLPSTFAYRGPQLSSTFTDRGTQYSFTLTDMVTKHPPTLFLLRYDLCTWN